MTTTQASMIFLYIVALLFGGIIVWQIYSGTAPNEVAVSFLTIIVGYTINHIGVQVGVNVSKSPVDTPIVEKPPV